MFTSVCLCVAVMVGCVNVVRDFGALRGHITVRESYRVAPNQPQGRRYRFQYYLPHAFQTPFPLKMNLHHFRLYAEGDDSSYSNDFQLFEELVHFYNSNNQVFF